MTKPLDAAEKRLRGMSLAQLADEVGTLKAAIAAADEQLGLVKAEGVRRELTEFDSEIFHCTLSPPADSRRLDGGMLKAVFGEAFVEHFSKTAVGENWRLNCYARPARKAA